MADAVDPTRARDAFEFLLESLGKPTKRALPVEVSESLGSIPSWSWLHFGDTETFHPVFAFAHHFRSFDKGASGYTANTFRGDHMSIPGYSEEGSIGVIDVSFHKGATALELITFEAVPADEWEARKWREKYAAAHTLLDEHETR